MLPLILLLAGPQSAASICARECQVLSDPRLKARACAACATAAYRAAWVEALPFAPDPALDEADTVDDWRVRAMVLALRAKRHRRSDEAELTAYLARSPLQGSVLAMHIPLSVPGVHQAEARRALELDIYSSDRSAQVDAVKSLAGWFREPPAAIVLDAMATRPAQTDPIAAQALSEALDLEPVGLAVIQAGTPDNQERVNRLLRVYSAQLDALRPGLSRLDRLERVAAVNEVGHLAPLSAQELTRALTDPDRGVRASALNWLARGEGKSPSTLVEERVRQGAGPSWVDLLGDVRDPGRAEAARRILRDATLPAAVRGAALRALGSTEGKRSWAEVKPFLADPEPALRAGAVAALDDYGMDPAANAAAVAALGDSAAEVVVAAVHVLAFPGKAGVLPRVSPLLSDGRPAVRAAAAQGLVRIGKPEVAMALGKRLKVETDLQVRRAIIRALRQLGGGPAMAALAEAAANDPDPGIRAAAADAVEQGSR